MKKKTKKDYSKNPLVKMGLVSVEEMKRRDKRKEECERIDEILDRLYENNPW